MEPGLRDKIERCKLLLVGTGGIGCEVLKNLTLTGFKNIDSIDLDTIDVSNLNRQFLFNKSNVGQSKAEVAVSIAKREYASSQEGLNLKAIHKSITLSEFDVDFFKQYSIVINALDNRAARSHVNRMCLNAGVPLLESGTAGYTGQAKMIKNSLTACYECEGLIKDGRTFATCTIRNTPSQPIHCIVWAKHLFHQLFGEPDPDNDVSPEMVKQTDPKLVFEKVFKHDIDNLLKMEDLWKNRRKPVPLDHANGVEVSEGTSTSVMKGSPFKLWTLKECTAVFYDAVQKLYQREGFQHWDKDDELALNFVIAASNLRSECFNIERKSPFDVKSLAGNIVPAISSTNSVVGGLLVLQAIRILKSIPIGPAYTDLEEAAKNEMLKDAGRTVYLNYTSLTRKDLIGSFECPPPNPECLACSRGVKPEVEIHLSMKDTTLADLVDKIIINTFAFVCPDLSLDDDSGIVIWSTADESENETTAVDKAKQRHLTDLPHIKAPKTRLMIYDMLQDKEISMILIDEEIDEELHNNFFYAKMNGKEL